MVRQDIAHLVPIAVDADIDRVQVEFRRGARIVGHIGAPAVGGFSAGDVMRLALDSVSLGELLKSGRLMQRPVFGCTQR